jgi:CheY-like chemotaxis protein
VKRFETTLFLPGGNVSKRVLIVDDHPDLRKLVRMTLDLDEYEMHEASNGELALKLAQQLRPQIILLDVMMPGSLDGYQVCEKIKNDPELWHTNVILLTARGQRRDLERGREVRADSYLVKPFSPLELIETVERAAQGVAGRSSGVGQADPAPDAAEDARPASEASSP